MGRSILIILMLAASPLSGAAESFSRQVDINPLPFGLTVMKGFGMGIGYEQIISGSLSWRVTFAGGTVPLDEYGDDINIAFFIPQAGFRWYPLRQGLKGWWIGSN
ncbi:MAG: hypothetical protein PQJ50_18375, partial [Spirochaetales bacterium]|nr:hypothetical protein [Spirochaetales bacterium]